MIVDLRLLLACGSVFLLLGCGSSTQQKETKWPNGKTREVWLEDGDGYRHGLASTYYENGKLQTQVTFHRDYPHGPFKMWDREGNIIAEGEFRDGQKWSGRFIRGDVALGRVNFEEWENGVMTSAPPPAPPRPPVQGPPPGTTPPGASGTTQAVPVTNEAPAPPAPDSSAAPQPPPIPAVEPPLPPPPPPPPQPDPPAEGAPAPPPPPPPPAPPAPTE